jgi:hypothetical protein
VQRGGGGGSLTLSKIHEILRKISRLIGYKGHRVHTAGHVDPAFLDQKTCIFSQFHLFEQLSLKHTE